MGHNCNGQSHEGLHKAVEAAFKDGNNLSLNIATYESLTRWGESGGKCTVKGVYRDESYGALHQITLGIATSCQCDTSSPVGDLHTSREFSKPYIAGVS